MAKMHGLLRAGFLLGCVLAIPAAVCGQVAEPQLREIAFLSFQSGHDRAIATFLQIDFVHLTIQECEISSPFESWTREASSSLASISKTQAELLKNEIRELARFANEKVFPRSISHPRRNGECLLHFVWDVGEGSLRADTYYIPDLLCADSSPSVLWSYSLYRACASARESTNMQPVKLDTVLADLRELAESCTTKAQPEAVRVLGGRTAALLSSPLPSGFTTRDPIELRGIAKAAEFLSPQAVSALVQKALTLRDPFLIEPLAEALYVVAMREQDPNELQWVSDLALALLGEEDIEDRACWALLELTDAICVRRSDTSLYARALETIARSKPAGSSALLVLFLATHPGARRDSNLLAIAKEGQGGRN